MLRECAGSRSEGTPRMRWIGNMKECLGKRGLNFREARDMVHDRSEWWGNEPLTLTRSQLYEVVMGWKSCMRREVVIFDK